MLMLFYSIGRKQQARTWLLGLRGQAKQAAGKLEIDEALSV